MLALFSIPFSVTCLLVFHCFGKSWLLLTFFCLLDLVLSTDNLLPLSVLPRPGFFSSVIMVGTAFEHSITFDPSSGRLTNVLGVGYSTKGVALTTLKRLSPRM
jgi:hypothetical protein